MRHPWDLDRLLSYAPGLNSVEYFWGRLKRWALTNYRPQTSSQSVRKSCSAYRLQAGLRRSFN
jgi:transposase